MMRKVTHWTRRIGGSILEVSTSVNNEQSDNEFNTVVITQESVHHPGYRHSTYVPREMLWELITVLSKLEDDE